MAIKTMLMGAGSLTFGAAGSLQNMSSQVTNCRATPKVDTGDALNVLSGDTAPGDRTETWTLAGTLVQDFGNASSVQQWLFDHRGTDMPFTFVPNTALGGTVAGTVSIEAVEIGGDVKTKPTADFEFAAYNITLSDTVA